MTKKAKSLSNCNPKDLVGVKKSSIHLVPPGFEIHVADAMKDGARKYGPYNWRRKSVVFSVYYDALMRHMKAYFDGEEVASDSLVDHLSHAAACLAIILDAKDCGRLVDDRPTKGESSRLLKERERSLNESIKDS